MASKTTLKVALALGGAVFLAACEDTNLPGFMQKSKDAPASAEGAAANRKSGERDVEAPEVFQKTESGLWDGRPSLGGVWVAHPDAEDPERVIIRNQANGKSVIGALFRRERDVPGPLFQVSSDAAEALGMLAGAPAKLNVTALRKEVIAADPVEAAPTTDLNAPEKIAQTKLDDPIAAANAALDAAEGGARSAAAAPPPPATPKPAESSGSALDKPFIQIGIFSIETNANNTAEALRQAGMIPAIKPGKSNGKDFWRVVVGPATSKSERNTLLKKVKGLGFTDAYFVTN